MQEFGFSFIGLITFLPGKARRCSVRVRVDHQCLLNGPGAAAVINVAYVCLDMRGHQRVQPQLGLLA